MEALGHTASVAQLVGTLGRLISKIIDAARTAHKNKLECEHLALRLSIISEVLPSLPQDTEVERLLKELGKTLHEAHELTLASFFGARRHADSFRGVNSRIDSHLSLFPLVIYTTLASRFDRISPPDQAGVTTTTAVPSPGSSSGSLQTQMVLPDDPRMFTFAEIAAATNHFAVELGGGCSGRVYKGRLHDGQEVAVKVLDKQGRQDVEHAFRTELEILFPLRHDHIVRLVGWCPEEKDPMFVYEHEHMSNGTLRDHLLHMGLRARMRVRLSGGSSSSPARVSWRTRVEVLLGASRAIAHLHCSGIIHLDVSSSNILLDATWTPRLSGFGAAVLQAPTVAGTEPVGQVVAEVVGTTGYLDPEYHGTGRVSPASDVYSFGVVMLEALTGEDPATLQVDSSLLAIHAPYGTLSQLEALELVAHTAGRCLYPRGKGRPSMPDVVANLEKALGIISS